MGTRSSEYLRSLLSFVFGNLWKLIWEIKYKEKQKEFITLNMSLKNF